jgi:predicted lactoylglutathione lyase
LLVLYIPDIAAINAIQNRLKRMAHYPVLPANPYWKMHGITFEDPDGWRVVLMNTAGLSA